MKFPGVVAEILLTSQPNRAKKNSYTDLVGLSSTKTLADRLNVQLSQSAHSRQITCSSG